MTQQEIILIFFKEFPYKNQRISLYISWNLKFHEALRADRAGVAVKPLTRIP
jgi:hypothetical protein